MSVGNSALTAGQIHYKDMEQEELVMTCCRNSGGPELDQSERAHGLCIEQQCTRARIHLHHLMLWIASSVKMLKF